MTKVILSMLEIKLEVDSQESGSHTFSAKNWIFHGSDKCTGAEFGEGFEKGLGVFHPEETLLESNCFGKRRRTKPNVFLLYSFVSGQCFYDLKAVPGINS